ncbi:type II toxin-antitoxin system PemK/MazF family toxin, partial [Mycolicibacterium vaccae]
MAPSSGYLKTFQRFLVKNTENLVFNEAPKLVRQLQRSETLQRGIAQGIRIGLDVLAAAQPPQPTPA